MILTPFEEAEQLRTKSTLFYATLVATHDLIQMTQEAEQQIEAYKGMLSRGEKSSQEERDVTVQAMKDMSISKKALVLLADTLEAEFGISA